MEIFGHLARRSYWEDHGESFKRANVDGRFRYLRYFFVAIAMRMASNSSNILFPNHLSGVLLPNSHLWRGHNGDHIEYH